MTLRTLDRMGSKGAGAGSIPLAAHDHQGVHEHDPAAPRRRRLGEWLFLASAFDRLLFVVLLVALIWFAVVWAVG